jgi:hypothetical protein
MVHRIVSAQPSRPEGPVPGRILRFLGVVSAALWMLGCPGGGGGGGGADHAPKPNRRAPTTLPLHIEAMYITQATQRLDGSIPLVRGRRGFLRVFALAKEWTGLAPEVRVRILDPAGNALLDAPMPGPVGGVPRAIHDTVMGENWNLPIDGALIQPGNRIEARIEAPPPGVPTGNLTFPADGNPQAMNVVAIPTLHLTLVPIESEAGVGRVNTGGRTLDSWLTVLKSHFPVNRVDVQMGPVLRTGQVPGMTGAANSIILGELRVLRWATRGGDYRYFYGVFRHRPGATHLGLGTLNPFPPDTLGRTAIGTDTDTLPEGETYADVFVHELGHNLGRRHAPCGNPPEVDRDYPYPGASIGEPGFDVARGVPLDPAVYKDDMSYCFPRGISDYTYENILRFRRAEPAEAGAAILAAPAQDCLVVTGSLLPGRVQWEPAFQLHRSPVLPRPGPFLLEALDDQGAVLEQVPFEPEAVEDDPESSAGMFSFVIPLTPAMKARLHTLRITKDGAVLGELHAAPPVRGGKAEPNPHAARDAHGQVHLVWDPETYPEVLVKDAHSGSVLGLGAGGKLELESHGHELECRFSDGLHTVIRRVPLAP